MDDPIEQFRQEVQRNIEGLKQDRDMQDLSRIWLRDTLKHRYSYNFSWMGRPIIQYPQDMMAMQELIWSVQPDLIIETGIAHGGSLVYYASLLELIGKGRVLGIDIEIRPHNRAALEAHPMKKRITLIEGSSIAPETVAQVKREAEGARSVMVVLDSNHTHDHVLAELDAYAGLVSVGSYCVVYDTVVEDLPPALYPNRPWDVGNNPKTAVWEYLKRDPHFEIDADLQAKLLVTVAPDGYLKRVR
ncbi:cephalosporin hydroxylase family protein [Aquabacterium sp. A7-Y]|uniref:cephalosporin hydroxylase family protein n=1 Tax=Aquabacterium sp. A7-Y TaxID=1349605 RepID=UPI00223DD833|nr:cephalosporin hydroxylase family protein [Aquabacterium sp. A7-Y]MCW7540529.1 cephalosporin hydroxylase family protein [Aquabacterium sp. A7-Y]